MSINLSPETQRLIQEWMEETGVTDADRLIRLALETLHQREVEFYDDLDEETRASIERGLAEADRGEGISVDAAREMFRSRYGKTAG